MTAPWFVFTEEPGFANAPARFDEYRFASAEARRLSTLNPDVTYLVVKGRAAFKAPSIPTPIVDYFVE